MSMMNYVVCLGLLVLPSVGNAADLYVSPAGNDAGVGTRDRPFASLAAARDAARKLAGEERVTVHVADGHYYFPETLVFTAADSGTAEHPVVYRAENEGGAVLSGGMRLKLEWRPYRSGIYSAKTPDGLVIDQLFIGGTNQRMARYPNYDASKKAEPYQGFAADAFARERSANWADPAGGYIHAMHRAGWGGYHYLITGKGDDGGVTYEGGWQNNRRMGMHKQHRMVENIFEELDVAGEWFHNAKTSTLYYKPEPGVELSKVKVEVVRLRHLVEFQGSEKAPVKFITLQGFTVRHAARTFMDCKEQLLRSDWAIYRGGAFVLTGTEDVSLVDCEFDQVGGNAVFVNNYNRRVLVKGCHIHDTGASGVCFVGDPDAVRNPLFEYGQKNDLATIDRTPGPKTNNYPAQSTVEDCLIHGIGRVERQPAGVQIEMAAEITVRDCSVYDTARAGINIGDGAWGGHLIERCDVFDTVLETHDHGSFNSWGRDRYWRHDHLTTSQKAVDAEPSLPFLDAMKTTVIRDSRWRCEHGWDIDLDDGSSNYDIYNNLMLCGGLKLREGFRRRVWNNVVVNNGLSSHVWFQNSSDQVTANIMARASGPYIQKDVTVDGLVDRNFYYDTDKSNLERNAEKFGWDRNSKSGDALFVDPDNGDFSVREGSPALDVGFRNFPMDQFGVKKPSLKAVAARPAFLPKSPRPAAPAKEPAVLPLAKVWLGATLQDLKGDEFSAFGVSTEDGGVVVADIPKASVAAKCGLQEGDLIQGIETTAVSGTNQLFRVLARSKPGSLKLKIVRNQQTLELSVEPESTMVFETGNAPGDFRNLPVPRVSNRSVTTNRDTSNDPLTILTDGRLSSGFGPVFGNGIDNGAYRMDLGGVMPVMAITSWSFRQGNARIRQQLTLYGSDSATDPGWDLSKFTPLGTIQSCDNDGNYLAASLRAVNSNTLGNFRWIVWSVSPVSDSGGGENTAFQELAVETVGAAEQIPVRSAEAGANSPTRSNELPAVRGQFVRIELPGEKRVLSLAEVSVFEKQVNVALKKKATQSTVAFSGAPTRTVDGNPDGDYRNGSVSHTESDGTDPWWEVNLGRTTDVEQVLIYNRTDSHGERLEGFTLKVLDAERKVVFSRESLPQSAVVSFLRTGVKSAPVARPVPVAARSKTNVTGSAHLFILAGQSNMVGLDPNVSFTPAVTRAFGSESVIVVKDAHNSQSISRWVKGWKSAQGQSRTGSGDLYNRMLSRVNDAVGGRDLETVTLVWMQGEADAAGNQVPVYKASLDGLLGQLRQDLKRDDIRCVLGRLSDYSLDTGKHPQWQAMRDLQVAYAKASPLRDWVDTDDLNNRTDPQTGKPKNDVHYTKDGYRVFGERLARKAIGLIPRPAFPGVKTDFRGYDRYDRIRTTAGHFSVICPKVPAPGKPWLWRSLFWEAIRKVSDADLKLVDEGYYVVLAHGDVAGHPSGNANIDAAYQLLTTEYGFSKKCANMSSMSRGTLSLFRWASANPEKVDSIYVDNGVCNVLSWPAGKLVPGSGSMASGAPSSWADFKRKFGYATDAEAIKTKESPIDQLEPLAKAGVPILMVCGNKDTAVPYEENDAIMEQRYRALGGSINVIVEDKGHSHGMNDPTPVLEFIRKHSSAELRLRDTTRNQSKPIINRTTLSCR
ncbi:MAG: right-handed parallel beta-helix repeat-containing protein [Planctomycetaceae bacterium]|nr:right-handed parallel beta-helix repeat-containing protein [Planctomycetaceae bacterium]